MYVNVFIHVSGKQILGYKILMSTEISYIPLPICFNFRTISLALLQLDIIVGRDSLLPFSSTLMCFFS